MSLYLEKYKDFLALGYPSDVARIKAADWLSEERLAEVRG